MVDNANISVRCAGREAVDVSRRRDHRKMMAYADRRIRETWRGMRAATVAGAEAALSNKPAAPLQPDPRGIPYYLIPYGEVKLMKRSMRWLVVWVSSIMFCCAMVIVSTLAGRSDPTWGIGALISLHGAMMAGELRP
jgi:hypothetical protein